MIWCSIAMRWKRRRQQVFVLLQALQLLQAFPTRNVTTQKNPPEPGAHEKKSKRTEAFSPRLSGGCSGTLQGLHGQSRTPVSLMTHSAEAVAQSVCKQLRCGDQVRLRWTAVDTNSSCLTNCSYHGSQLTNCTDSAPGECSTVADIACFELRLVGGIDNCSGRVELMDGGQWGTVCDDGWDLSDANVVCNQLGCGSAFAATGGNVFGPGVGRIILSDVNCSGMELGLQHCSATNHRDFCGHKEDAGVVCSASLTPSPVENSTSGITNATWSTVQTIVVSEAAPVAAPVVGCIILTILLLMVPIVNAVLCWYYRRKRAFPIGQLHTHLEASPERQDNNYLESSELLNVDTANIVVMNVHEPQRQDSAEISSLDSDYEQFDFSADPKVALAVYKSSIRDRTEDRSPRMSSVLFPLPEEEHRPASPAPWMQQLNDGTSSACSSENYINQLGSSLGPNTEKHEDFCETSSTSSGEWYENTKSVDEDELVTAGNAALPDEPLQPPLSSPACDPSEVVCSIPSVPLCHSQEDSFSSTSDDYENVGEDAFQAMNGRPVSSSDCDYDEVASISS